MKLILNVNILFRGGVKLMKDDFYSEDNGKSIDFKEVLTKNGFNNDIADYILKQMYCQSYINPVNWECYCNMNNKILKLKQEHQEEF